MSKSENWVEVRGYKVAFFKERGIPYRTHYHYHWYYYIPEEERDKLVLEENSCDPEFVCTHYQMERTSIAPRRRCIYLMDYSCVGLDQKCSFRKQSFEKKKEYDKIKKKMEENYNAFKSRTATRV